MATKMVYPVHGISKDRCHTLDIADPVCRQQTMTCMPAPLQNEVHRQLAGLQGIGRLRALWNAGKSSAAEALVKAHRGKAGRVKLRQPNENQWTVIIPDLN